MLREEWEKSEDAQSILLIYDHEHNEALSEIFSGYECGFKARDRKDLLAEELPHCSFSVMDNDAAIEQLLTVILADLGYEESEDDINFP